MTKDAGEATKLNYMAANHADLTICCSVNTLCFTSKSSTGDSLGVKERATSGALPWPPRMGAYTSLVPGVSASLNKK